MDQNDDILTMPEAQEYLLRFGVPVRSRNTFYRYIDKHRIPYIDLTPWSSYKNRRFKKGELDRVLQEMGYEVHACEDTSHGSH